MERGMSDLAVMIIGVKVSLKKGLRKGGSISNEDIYPLLDIFSIDVPPFPSPFSLAFDPTPEHFLKPL